MHIVLIEQTDTRRIIMDELLSELGCITTTCAELPDISVLNEQSSEIDAFMIDLNQTNFEHVKQIRMLPHFEAVPVIALVPLNKAALVRRAEKMERFFTFVKPVKKQLLLQTLVKQNVHASVEVKPSS